MATKQQNYALKLKTIQLNKLLKPINKLSIKDTTLINLLVELIDNNYDFTNVQFSNFIDQICYKNGKLPCYLSWIDTIPKKIITYMLTHNHITDSQITQLCEALCGARSGGYIINILFEQKHEFTIDQFKFLIQIAFECPNIDNYDSIHNNIIFMICLCIIENKHQDYELFRRCILMVKQNALPFNIQHLEIILYCLETKQIKPNQITNQTTYTLKLLLDALFLNNGNGTEIFDLIIKTKCLNFYNIFIIEYVINKFECDTRFANYVCDNFIQDNPNMLFKLMLKGYESTTNNINSILKKTSNIKINANDNFDMIGLTQEQIKEIANSYGMFHVANLFNIFDLVPDINTLNIVCEKRNNPNIKFMVEKYNLIPEKSTLDICASSRDYDAIEYIINYKITPDINTLHNLCNETIGFSVNENEFFGGPYNYINNIKKIIDLFIFHGLNINNDMVIYFGTKGIFLDNLERFDITQNEQLYFLRYLNNRETCKQAYKYTFDNNIIELHKLCLKKSLNYDKLMVFLKTNDVKLDRFALDLIYLTIPSLGAKLTNDHNCIPSILTAYNRFIVGPYPSSPRLKVNPEHLINKCKLTYNDMFEQYNI